MMLGHSVDTNLKYYSFARSNEYLEELSVKWDDYIESMNCSKRNGRGTNIRLYDKRKEPENREFSSSLLIKKTCGRWDLNPLPALENP